MRKFNSRDLSWLSFNFRVLLEAKRKTVPILARLRFLAIYSSNLDEFFRVRVAGLRNLQRLNKPAINKDVDPGRLLQEIQQEVNRQMEIYGNTWKQVLRALRREGIRVCRPDELTAEQAREVRRYFSTHVAGYLQPYLSDEHGKQPFLNNGALYFGVQLKSDADQRTVFGYVNIPSAACGRFLRLKTKRAEAQHYLLIDDVVRMNISSIFPGYDIVACKSVKLNKDADLQIEDEYTGDLVRKIKKQLARRNLGSPARFLYDQTMSSDMLDWFTALLHLEQEDLYPGGAAHNLSDYMRLPRSSVSALDYHDHVPLTHPRLGAEESVLKAIEHRDCLLHLPYHQYDEVLRLFNDAAISAEVREIQVAFYRMSSNSMIGEALISAAKNGKKVNVFMEVKARFDEENNLHWARRFKAAGANVIYSIPGIKVHAKIALFRRFKNLPGPRHIAFLGTGNLNEKTAAVYADYVLLTSRQALTAELEDVFRYLSKGVQPAPFQQLLVSQFNMLSAFHELIDGEIAAAESGRKAVITIKLNNLEEQSMIEHLYRASRAGVEVRLIVRGICCLRPGIKRLSENITVKRLVDRFLEHARIFVFHRGGEEKVYLGSADWMNRNLHHRIEVVFPILDPVLKAEILEAVRWQWMDNSSAYLVNKSGGNVPPAGSAEKEIRAQEEIYSWLKKQKKQPHDQLLLSRAR